jgi:hypothetical protein
MRHLEDNTLELAKKIRRLKETDESKPRDINHWLIPGAVLGTIGLWIATVIALAGRHSEPPTGDTLLLVTAAGVATGTTVLYVKDYLRQRTMGRDHQAILNALDALRQDVTEHREVYKERFAELLERLDAVENAGWQDAAEQVKAIVGSDGRGAGTDGAEIVRMGRRNGS